MYLVSGSSASKMEVDEHSLLEFLSVSQGDTTKNIWSEHTFTTATERARKRKHEEARVHRTKNSCIGNLCCNLCCLTHKALDLTRSET